MMTLLRLVKVLIYFSISLAFSVVPAYSQSDALRIEDDRLLLPAVSINNKIFQIEFSVFDSGTGLELELASFARLEASEASQTDGISSFSNLVLSIPSLELNGVTYQADFRLTDLERIRFSLISTVLAGSNEQQPVDPAPSSCNMEMDLTNGDDNPVIDQGWAAEVRFVMDGGPAPDGIPPIENPQFLGIDNAFVFPDDLVVGVKIGDDIRAYPHDVLNYHEVVNDRINLNGISEPVTLSYCPLTGSAMLWEGNMSSANPTFGTSGLLYNSNLIMYDRETESFWSQMLEQAIFGQSILAVPDKIQVVETTMETWSQMYPDSKVLSRLTGFSRNYNAYPYGDYRSSRGLLFQVNNIGDLRLHSKERVVGVTNRDAARAYVISELSDAVEVINDEIADMPIVVAGSSGSNLGVIYSRQLSDCSILEFDAVENSLPIIMSDNEGNEWDVFGVAQSGPRAGESLQKTNSYISYWFSWAAFFPQTEIYQ